MGYRQQSCKYFRQYDGMLGSKLRMGTLNMTANNQGCETDSARLRVVFFTCHRVAPETDGAGHWPEAATGFEWRIIRQACSEKLQVVHVLRALEEGADGVCVVACPEGECEFLDGSLRTRKRMERARSLLEEIGLGGNRAMMISVDPSAEKGTFEEQVLAAARGFEALGVSPLGR